MMELAELNSHKHICNIILSC